MIGLIALCGGIIWLCGVKSRDWIIDPVCQHSPSFCQSEHLLPVDRYFLGVQDPKSDRMSFDTQSAAGVLSTAVALFSPLPVANLTYLVAVVLWNGAFTEWTRVITQRPRPFVYGHPVYHGELKAHYTSFVSGHTSFVGSAMLASFFILRKRKGSKEGAKPWISSYLALAILITIMTGLFRVLAGRHFPTDVFGAAVLSVCLVIGSLRLGFLK